MVIALTNFAVQPINVFHNFWKKVIFLRKSGWSSFTRPKQTVSMFLSQTWLQAFVYSCSTFSLSRFGCSACVKLSLHSIIFIQTLWSFGWLFSLKNTASLFVFVCNTTVHWQGSYTKQQCPQAISWKNYYWSDCSLQNTRCAFHLIKPYYEDFNIL